MSRPKVEVWLIALVVVAVALQAVAVLAWATGAIGEAISG